jgi:hypothetical protein
MTILISRVRQVALCGSVVHAQRVAGTVHRMAPGLVSTGRTGFAPDLIRISCHSEKQNLTNLKTPGLSAVLLLAANGEVRPYCWAAPVKSDGR